MAMSDSAQCELFCLDGLIFPRLNCRNWISNKDFRHLTINIKALKTEYYPFKHKRLTLDYT